MATAALDCAFFQEIEDTLSISSAAFGRFDENSEDSSLQIIAYYVNAGMDLVHAKYAIGSGGDFVELSPPEGSSRPSYPGQSAVSRAYAVPSPTDGVDNVIVWREDSIVDTVLEGTWGGDHINMANSEDWIIDLRVISGKATIAYAQLDIVNDVTADGNSAHSFGNRDLGTALSVSGTPTSVAAFDEGMLYVLDGTVFIRQYNSGASPVLANFYGTNIQVYAGALDTNGLRDDVFVLADGVLRVSKDSNGRVLESPFGSNITLDTELDEIYLGDLDGDGDSDIVGIDVSDGVVSLYENDGGDFLKVEDGDVILGTMVLGVGDFDQNGAADFMLSNDEDNILIYRCGSSDDSIDGSEASFLEEWLVVILVATAVLVVGGLAAFIWVNRAGKVHDEAQPLSRNTKSSRADNSRNTMMTSNTEVSEVLSRRPMGN